jgi:hypothetical protein
MLQVNKTETKLHNFPKVIQSTRVRMTLERHHVYKLCSLWSPLLCQFSIAFYLYTLNKLYVAAMH